MNNKYYLSNLLPDESDHRDFIFKTTMLPRDLPRKFDYINYAGEIENQLTLGSCVANSTASSLELLAQRNGLTVDYSRLFLYYNLREPYSELKGKDNGAYMRDGFKMVNKFGICNESDWDYIISNVNVTPSDLAYNNALQNKVTEYQRIISGKNDTITNIKYALLNGYPIIFGITLDESFYYISGSLANQKYLGTNNPKKIIGSHAMSIIGYDDDLNSFIVENSWGTDWGDKGLCLIPYDVLQKDCSDIWICTGFKDFKMDAMYVAPKPTLMEKIKSFIKDNKQFLIILLISFGISLLEILINF